MTSTTHPIQTYRNEHITALLTVTTRSELVPVLVERNRLTLRPRPVVPHRLDVAQHLSRRLLVRRQRVPRLDRRPGPLLSTGQVVPRDLGVAQHAQSSLFAVANWREVAACVSDVESHVCMYRRGDEGGVRA